MKNMPIILSIIVPIYNSEKYLEECLWSLTKQNFTSNVEVLLIDDGSTDKSYEIAKRFCHLFKYFKLFQKKNGGVSSARNLGLSISKGKWISFIDSDDFITDNCYLLLIDTIEKTKSDGAYFGHSTNVENLETYNCSWYKPNKKNVVKQSVCRMIFNSDIIKKNDIKFDESVKYNEDFYFNFNYILSCKNGIIGNSQCLYYVRLNENSATGHIRTKDQNKKITYLTSLLNVGSNIKKTAASKNLTDDVMYKQCISQVMLSYLWGAMIFKEKPSLTLEAARKYGLNVKDIHYKVYEGNNIKSFIEYSFRHRFMYKFFCFIYKIFM